MTMISYLLRSTASVGFFSFKKYLSRNWSLLYIKVERISLYFIEYEDMTIVIISNVMEIVPMSGSIACEAIPVVTMMTPNSLNCARDTDALAHVFESKPLPFNVR